VSGSKLFAQGAWKLQEWSTLPCIKLLVYHVYAFML
jgi:hypothetical protein